MVNNIILWLRPWQVRPGVKWLNGAVTHLVPALVVSGQLGKNPANVGMPTTASFGLGHKQIFLGSC
jgi:hypothetical protein